MDSGGRIESLTEAEREVLRLILVHSDAKLIGRAIDRSVHAVDQRLRSARRKLGVSRSLDAAMLLARAEGGPTVTPAFVTYEPVELRHSVAVPMPPPPAIPVAEGGWEHSLPFPTKGRPWNALPPIVRLAWIAAGMVAVSISSLAIVAMAEALSRIAQAN